MTGRTRFVLLVVGVAVLTSVATSAQAQRGSPTPAEVNQLRAENERLTTEVQRLTAEVSRLTAEVNRLSSAGSAASVGSAQRQDALTSLRAVQSVLSGGGSRTDFRKYQLEAKVKVDALPDTPENAPMREVSRIFTDASSLLTAGTAQSMSASDVGYFKKQYSNDLRLGGDLAKIFGDIPATGFDRDDSIASKVAAIRANQLGQLLLIAAEETLKRVK
jgi:outer membrane murein-binding lipoprotein Lpp